MGTFLSLDDLPYKNVHSVDFEHGNFPLFGSKIWSYMKYDTVIYCFYSAKKGIDFGKSLFVLEGIYGNWTAKIIGAELTGGVPIMSVSSEQMPWCIKVNEYKFQGTFLAHLSTKSLSVVRALSTFCFQRLLKNG